MPPHPHICEFSLGTTRMQSETHTLMCIHACTHVYVCVLYMQTFTCTYNIQLPAYTHRCTFINMVYTHMHTYAFRHKCIYKDVYTHKYVHTHAGTHIFIYTNTHIHLFANSTTHAKNQDKDSSDHSERKAQARDPLHMHTPTSRMNTFTQAHSQAATPSGATPSTSLPQTWTHSWATWAFSGVDSTLLPQLQS